MMSKALDVIVYACNWDGLSCVEAVAHEGLSYPASVKVVRVNCLSRVHLGLILKAFELGAGAVVLLGCEPNQCHYDVGAKCIQEEYEKAQKVMKLMGLASDRLALALVPGGDGAGLVNLINKLISQIGDAPFVVSAARER